jgi:tetratricopeptide (TPR) repeat protein
VLVGCSSCNALVSDRATVCPLCSAPVVTPPPSPDPEAAPSEPAPADSDTPRDWNDRGGKLFAAGRYPEALACFEGAIARSPLYVEAWVNKANALFESGQHDEGLQAALRAIEVAPLFARTWFNKGAMENRMGRSALALASFREFLSLGTSEPPKLVAEARRATRELEAGGKRPSPRSAHAFLTQASQLSAEGKFAQAVEALDRALALLPNLGTALLLKGDALAEMGHPRKSMACYDQGLEADAGDPRLWHAKGAASSRQRRHDKALACFEEALRLDPGHLPSRNGRAWALLQGGRHPEALAAFEEVLARESRHSLARFGKACAEDQLGRRAEAARSYKKFLDRAERPLAPQIEHARTRIRALKP